MGVRNLGQFLRGLDRFAEKIEKRGIEFQKKVAFLVLGAYVQTATGSLVAVSGLLQLTPVDTGRAVGNWQMTVGQPASGEVERGVGAEGGGERNRGPAAAKATRAGVRSLSGLRLGQTIWIVNNLPYIVVLNDGGTNRTAHHMLERSVENARASIR